MSLITCCPACSTLFRVVPDQLRISDGWVRCGHCAQVFDANAHMQGVPLASQRAGDPGPSDSAPLPNEAPSPPVSPDGLDLELAAAPAIAVIPQELVLPAAASSSASAVPGTRAPVAPQGPDPTPEQDLEALLHADELAADAARSVASFDADSSLEDEQDKPAFVREATRKAFWRLPVVRAGLQLACGLLAVLLGLQMLVQERDRVAVLSPRLVPLLRALCRPVACELAPLRQIESVAVDSSVFSKVRPEVFRLNFVLKNNAALPLSMPAIELTLTDATEQAVVRRVVLPVEFGALQPVLAPGAEFPAKLTVAMAPGVDGTTVTGYRVLAFYP